MTGSRSGEGKVPDTKVVQIEIGIPSFQRNLSLIDAKNLLANATPIFSPPLRSKQPHFLFALILASIVATHAPLFFPAPVGTDGRN